MIAKAVPHIVLTAIYKIDGELILETDCGNFDDYKALPSVVIYEGVICGLSGWSSDRHYACYKSSVRTARIVRS